MCNAFDTALGNLSLCQSLFNQEELEILSNIWYVCQNNKVYKVKRFNTNVHKQWFQQTVLDILSDS